MHKSTIFAISLLLLAGCATAPESTITPATTTPTKALPAAPDLTSADQTAYDNAISLTDTSFCEKISAVEKVTACKQAVADQKLLNEAVAQNDQSLCQKISREDMQKACTLKLEAAKKTSDQQAQAQQALKGQYDSYSQLIDAGKVEDCAKSLSDPSFIANCQATIITNQAISAKDPAKCDAIKDTISKTDCQKAVAAAPK